MTRKNWSKLLSESRLTIGGIATSSDAPQVSAEDLKSAQWMVQSRTESERDFDRILFSTPTRRLGDKTQVFPLEKNESVRNRLTHSHEVAALARSIGTHMVHSPLFDRISQDSDGGESETARIRRAIPAVLGAVGLAHDLGNPPFGHQGEAAIGSWIVRNESRLFSLGAAEKKRWGKEGCKAIIDDLNRLTEGNKQDFRAFEGNAQTLRTLTRLQVVKDNRGLNLSFGTLAAIMKYTVPSDQTGGKKGPAHAKKFGYYQSEAEIVKEVRQATGLAGDSYRHPLTYIMEACDDAAYVVIDAEDAVKKQIVSFPDLLSWLASRDALKRDDLALWVLGKAHAALDEVRNAKLSSSEQNDVCTQIFRANAITAVVSAAITAFQENYDDIMDGGLDCPLLETSLAHPLIEEVRTFDRERAYSNRRVLEIELSGYNTLLGLMDMLWRGITEREQFDRLDSKRTSPFARYAYGRISENYRRVFEGGTSALRESDTRLPIRYKELQLLTDMVAGMTDQFAIDLHDELEAFHIGASLS